MTDPIRRGLSDDLHAIALEEAVACDYHQRPMEITTDDPVLCEAIRIVEHPQLDEYPDHWLIDAARCSEHSTSEIEEPTRGFEEAVIHVPVDVSNDVVSIHVPESDDIRVRAFSPANEGLHPMVIDQQLLDATDPNDYGFSRWNRVEAMLAGQPAQPFREHIEHLSDGGSNRLSNLELLCIDCHNDRHDHDIREGRDGYDPEPGLWDRLRQVVYAVVGGIVLLPLHGMGMYALLTQSVGSPFWIAGVGYLLVLAVGILLRPVQIAALYTAAATAGLAIVHGLSIDQIGGVSVLPPVLTAWVPVVLAAGWWWSQR